MKISSILLTTSLLFLSSNISANTIFKCKNKQGTYTYQEKPCSIESNKDSSWGSKARQNTFSYSPKSSLKRASGLQQIKDARRIDINSLPLKLAIREIKGNGSRKLVIFSDPNCGYCKRLERELVKITDITIYTFLYPILNGSKEISEAIWCSDDQLKTWNAFMLNAVKPAGTNCNAPIDTLLQIGKEHGFNGTPTMIFANGAVAPGMISAEMIEKKLNIRTD